MAAPGAFSRLLNSLLEGPYGFDSLLTARTESLKTLATLTTKERVVVWQGLRDLGQWAAATLLWTGAGLGPSGPRSPGIASAAGLTAHTTLVRRIDPLRNDLRHVEGSESFSAHQLGPGQDVGAPIPRRLQEGQPVRCGARRQVGGERVLDLVASVEPRFVGRCRLSAPGIRAGCRARLANP